MTEKESQFPVLVKPVDYSLCDIKQSSTLVFDEACVIVTSEAKSTLSILAQSVECIECDLLEWATLQPNSTVALLVKSRHDLIFNIASGINNTDLCSLKRGFRERSMFELAVNETSCGNLVTLREPDDTVLPMFLVLLTLAGLFFLWKALRFIARTEWGRTVLNKLGCRYNEEVVEDAEPIVSMVMPLVPVLVVLHRQERLKSLDTFRGLCIFVMIFVNYGGGKYLLFEHSVWNGLTVADMVFPSFMWMMGLSYVLWLNSQIDHRASSKTIYYKVLKRCLRLAVIGFILSSSSKRNNLASFRVFSVLFRLSFAYGVTAVVDVMRLFYGNEYLSNDRRLMWLDDIRGTLVQWSVSVGLVVLHTVLTFALPVPNCPSGYLGPGGLHAHGNFSNCTGGSSGYVDRLLFGVNHLYSTPTFMKTYHTTINFDPEGLLGCLTSVLLLQFGVQAGRTLFFFKNPVSCSVRWMIWALCLGLLGGGLCYFKIEGGLIPINKNLFSLSFVLVNAAINFAVLTLLYIVVDVKKWWLGQPFCYAGMNPLFLYVAHGFFKSTLPWKWVPISNTHAELLAMDTWAACLWLVVAYQLFRHKMFFTV